jgi:predicted esterase
VPEWIPQAPIYVFHSTKDDVVTFQSALHLQRYIGDRANITYDFDNYGGHLKSIYTFYAKIQSMLNVKKKQ